MTARVRMAGTFALALLLAACATPTPYQPLGKDQSVGGYMEQKLESTRYRISFVGNGATPRERARDYALYRAAELTLFNGYDYFLVASESLSGEPSGAGGSGVGVGFGLGSFGSHTGVSVGVSNTIGGGGSERIYAQLDILMYKGAKPADQDKAMDAREIKANLESGIQRPTPGG